MISPDYKDAKRHISYGEVLPIGTLIDLMPNSAGCRGLRFVTSDGNPANFLPKFELNGYTYHPPDLHPALLRAVRFPARLGKRLTTSKLVPRISDVLRTNLLFSQDDADLVSFFCLSTWFPEFLPGVPSLAISGIDPQYGFEVVQVLAQLCRRPLLLGNTRAGWSGVADLRPTVLLFDDGSTAALGAGLEGSNYPGLGALNRSGIQNFCFSKVLFSPPGAMQPLSMDSSFLQIALAEPSSRIRIRAAQLEEIADVHQPLLLTYRLANWQKVQSSTFQVRDFSFPIANVAAALGACLCGNSDLESRLVELLSSHDVSARRDRIIKPEPVLVEVLLGAVHKLRNQPGKGISVKKVMELLNATLRSRGSAWEFNEEEVGWKLKKLGVPATGRNAKGKQLVLLGVSSRVHRLARSYAVATEPIPGLKCEDCERAPEM